MWRTVFQIQFPLEKGKVFIWEDSRNPKMLHSAGPLSHRHYPGIVYDQHILPLFKLFPGKWQMRCQQIEKVEE
jgi:hypothetical protein